MKYSEILMPPSSTDLFYLYVENCIASLVYSRDFTDLFHIKTLFNTPTFLITYSTNKKLLKESFDV